MKYELGLSSCGKELNEQLFSEYQRNGITKMEISERYYENFDYKEVARLAQKYGVELWSLHFPFYPEGTLDISATDATVRNYTLETYKELILQGSAIGIKIFILHPSCGPFDQNERENKLLNAEQSLRILAEFADQYGAVIAVEDMCRVSLGNTSKEILRLISVDDRLKVCFDSNHLLQEEGDSFILAVGDRLITTHISDYDFVNERHWLPGEGKIDWKKILSALEKVGYTGPWLYEVEFAIPQTILRDRELTCEDFARNAKEVFEGKEITVFSRPKPNLGMWS
ncbi:MAG: sugar phosphate isomerase/epimerase [Clostridia bacterium]|nr:sugar phosphate isomerase/epimerase [Clostridia bacterium]